MLPMSFAVISGPSDTKLRAAVSSGGPQSSACVSSTKDMPVPALKLRCFLTGELIKLDVAGGCAKLGRSVGRTSL